MEQTNNKQLLEYVQNLILNHVTNISYRASVTSEQDQTILDYLDFVYSDATGYIKQLLDKGEIDEARKKLGFLAEGVVEALGIEYKRNGTSDQILNIRSLDDHNRQLHTELGELKNKIRELNVEITKLKRTNIELAYKLNRNIVRDTCKCCNEQMDSVCERPAFANELLCNMCNDAKIHLELIDELDLAKPNITLPPSVAIAYGLYDLASIHEKDVE